MGQNRTDQGCAECDLVGLVAMLSVTCNWCDCKVITNQCYVSVSLYCTV